MASQKLTQLDATTSLNSSDLFYVVQDVGTTPTSFKVQFSDIASSISAASLTVKEIDGSPSVTPVNTIKVSNGTLTDNGGGVVTVTTGGGGGGGALTFVGKQTVSGGAVQDVTLSGLDGDTDEIYRLICRVKFAQTCNVQLRANGSNTNVSATIWDRNGFDAGNYIMNVAANDYVQLSMDFSVKSNPDGQAFSKWGTGTATRILGPEGQVIAWTWNDTSTNLTSFTFHASVSAAIDNGSTFVIYKYAQS